MPSQTAGTGSDTSTTRRGATIAVAIVDDSPPDQALIAAMLGQNLDAAVETATAHSLATALELVTARRFDCVLLDLHLPDGDGVDLVRRLVAAAPDVAVVVLTGERDTESATAALALGAQDYLHKDRIDGDVLWRAIRYAVDRHDNHRALMLSEQRHRRVLDAVGEGIVLFEALPDGTIRRVLANPVAEAIADRVGLRILEGSHDGGTRRIIDQHGRLLTLDDLPVMQVARTGFASECDVLGLIGDGDGDGGTDDDRNSDGDQRGDSSDEPVWVRTTARPIVDDSGRLTGIVASMTDITEERKASRRLSQSEDRFAAIIEHNAEPIALYDADGIVSYASPALGRATGCDSAAHLGRPVLELVHPEDRSRLLRLARLQLGEPGSVIRFECRMRGPEGTWSKVAVTQTNLLRDPAVRAMVVNARAASAEQPAGGRPGVADTSASSSGPSSSPRLRSLRGAGVGSRRVQPTPTPHPA